MKILDGKFYIDGENLVKLSNGEIIPLEEEPVFVFRARDILALPTLKYYQTLCRHDQCTDYQLTSLQQLVERFEEFKQKFPERMKQPGITRGV